MQQIVCTALWDWEKVVKVITVIQKYSNQNAIDVDCKMMFKNPPFLLLNIFFYVNPFLDVFLLIVDEASPVFIVLVCIDIHSRFFDLYQQCLSWYKKMSSPSARIFGLQTPSVDIFGNGFDFEENINWMS